jgi:hypothetical protein
MRSKGCWDTRDAEQWELAVNAEGGAARDAGIRRDNGSLPMMWREEQQGMEELELVWRWRREVSEFLSSLQS